MSKTANQQNLSEFLKDYPKNFWFCLVFLFIAVAIFHGKTVPFSNEFLYLLRLKPDFLSNDWTFSSPAYEHWLFNQLFSFPARFFSLEAIGWIGRITVWILSLTALIKLGKHWEITFWAIAISIFLWLAFGQSVVNDEWIFGGFEAKTVSYVCLLFSLHFFIERLTILPSVLLGLSFCFHPAVGLWAVLAVGLALLFERVSFVYLSKIIGLTAVFVLLGILSLLSEQTNETVNSFDNWRFITLIRVPWHLDPFVFSKSGMMLIYAMLIFNFFTLRKSEDFAMRFLLKFQIALGMFFLSGLILRWFEFYSLLRFMPMRLFPIFTPLFFIFTAFRVIPQFESKNLKIGLSAFVIIVILLLNPFGKGFSQISQTFKTWTIPPDDLQKASVWIAENISENANVIQPPNRNDFWYFSRRASIVSYSYPTYNRLDEWRERLADLTNNLQISDGEHAGGEIETAYNQLSAEKIAEIKTKYHATHLVSRAEYSYPIIYKTETYKIYQLP